MTRRVNCVKLKREADGLTHPPMPGDMGKKIFDQISAEAWAMWIEQQTMLINEYRLSMADAKSRVFLKQEMENFLFGDGSEKPAGFVPKE